MSDFGHSFGVCTANTGAFHQDRLGLAGKNAYTDFATTQHADVIKSKVLFCHILLVILVVFLSLFCKNLPYCTFKGSVSQCGLCAFVFWYFHSIHTATRPAL